MTTHEMSIGSNTDMATTAGVDPMDSYNVSWDGDNDPAKPVNWKLSLRWGHIVLVSLLTLVTSISSDMLAPAVPDVMKSLRSDNLELASFVVSIYVLGSALGPLVVSPLSELYGRAIVYNVSNVLFLGSTIGCALSTDIGMMIAFRFLSGFAGVTPLALGGGSIGDIMPSESIGIAMAVWALGSLTSPFFAPIAGGYLSETVGWRWIFWVIAIPAGILSLISPFLLRETYTPIILARKAKRMRQQTGDLNYRVGTEPEMHRHTVILQAFARPIRMLLTTPIILILAVNVAVIYGYLYLVFTTLSYIFQDQYHFSSGLSGLTYLGEGVGTLSGIFVVGAACDKVISRKKKAEQEVKPEDWLWPMIPGAFLIPAGLFWYGWTLEANVFPVVPLIGMAIFGFGMMAIFQPVQTYIVKAFPVHAASASAGTNLLRSIAGALLPLSGHKLYDALGLGWGNSLLAFIALALAPLPFLLIRYGERLRAYKGNSE